MQEPLTKSIILPSKSWPTPQDYNEAVQTRIASFSDPLLRDSFPEQNALGLPKATSGAFASVYKMTHGSQTFALRFFLRQVDEERARYETLSQFILADDLPYTVPFEYVHNGVRVRAHWYPLVKMEWVNGVTLDEYIKRSVATPERLEDLAAKIETMCAQLRAAGVAHGDLQHGNIIVLENGDLRLVDYDGMFVPAMDGLSSTELGHRNYQHPRRCAIDFNVGLDRFSELVIVNSLRILARDPALLETLHGGDECIILRQHDFTHPLQSLAFHELEKHADAKIVWLARSIRWQLQFSVTNVLVPSELPDDIPELPALAKPHEWVPPYAVPPGHAYDADQQADHQVWINVSPPPLTGEHLQAQPRTMAAIRRSNDLVRLRSIVRADFQRPGKFFASENLEERFWVAFKNLLFNSTCFTSGDLSLVTFASLPCLLSMFFVDGWHALAYPLTWFFLAVLCAFVYRCRRIWKCFKRVESHVRKSLPVRVNLELRELANGFFERNKHNYQLVVVDPEEKRPCKMKDVSSLPVDLEMPSDMRLWHPSEQFVFVDPATHYIVARIVAGKVEWVI